MADIDISSTPPSVPSSENVPVQIIEEVEETNKEQSPMKQRLSQLQPTQPTLIVSNLSYDPAITFADFVNDNVEACCPQWTFPAWTYLMNQLIPNPQDRARESVAPLRNITFTAPAGKVTAIMSNTYGERRTLIDLIAGRRKRGAYDGHVLLGGISRNELKNANVEGSNSDNLRCIKDHIAYVPRKVSYIPGLTFLQTLRYSARLRMPLSIGLTSHEHSNAVEERVEEILQLMGLKHCANRMLTEGDSDSAVRGELGGDLRRLSIAIEIVNLPAVIVVDDPQHALDPGVAIGIFTSLKSLAQLGHIVLLSIPKPSPILLANIDTIVLLADGHSIYASQPHNLISFFCSPKVGYSFNKTADLMEWILDIAAGTERPTTQRTADDPSIQQEKFESSPFFVRPHAGVDALTAFPTEMFRFFGYATRLESPLSMTRRFLVVFQRCLHVKSKEYAVIKTSFGGSVLVGLIVGYLQYGIGSYGQYTMSLINYPYVNTSNVTALLFFVCAFPFTQQVLAVQYLCKKISNFRYEQQAGVCSTPIFSIATFLSEVPFVLFYAFTFATIIYFMASLNLGVANYCFFVQEVGLFALIGFLTAQFFAVLLREEILVRDTFLSCLFLALMLSGFPFQLTFIRSYVSDITVINPMRWSYESLMSWKFGSPYYKDGSNYLKPYGFSGFNHTDVFPIFGNFIAFSLVLSTFLLLPLPNFLRRSKTSKRSRRSMANSLDEDFLESGSPAGSVRESFDLIFPRTRTMDLTKPLIFARESSLSGSQRLSINLSQNSGDPRLNLANRGPTVAFHNLTYRIKARTAAAGHKTILDRISGQFDWGKLSCILGAPRSGKTSLLHILAGDKSIRSEVQGDIFYDGQIMGDEIPLWQRCALVECKDNQLSSLTVQECISYAMQLRCRSRRALRIVQENVTRTMDILLLHDVADKKVRTLSAGERRRLSIAEEIVHGPSLLLIDEPETGLSPLDASVLYRAFREMVNQDKTVIASLHQPSSAVFALFDTLVLLSNGKIIYHGKASAAVSFFHSSPYTYSFHGYHNPGDFLTDVSGGFLADGRGQWVGSDALCAHYKTTDQYKAVWRRLQDTDKHISAATTAASQSQSPGQYSGLNSAEMAPGMSDSDQMDEPPTLGYFYLAPQIVKNLRAYCVGCLYWSDEQREALFVQSYVLLHRSAWALWNRRSIVYGTIAAHIFLACILGWILGNSSSSIYNVTSFFAVGTLLLVLGNVQLISYLFQTHQVFLKESSRGLYSNLVYWSVAAWPLYLLRAVNAILYAAIAYELLMLADGKEQINIAHSTLPSLTYLLHLSNPTTVPGQSESAASIEGFFILCTIFATIGGTMMSEAVVYIVPDIRSAYLLIPALSFVQFAFSGLFLKPSLLPEWLAPWAPSISIIRWCMQAEFINQFDGSKVVPFAFNIPMYNAFSAFLSLFGWGGKTKWYCFLMILVIVAIMRFATLISTAVSSAVSRGGRRFN